MPAKIITSQILVPLGSVCAAVTVTASVCSWALSSRAELKAQVDDLDRRVTRAEQRQDKADERWDQIRDDLAKIKERLGIVEANGGKK
jgi:hypothetical protein